MVGCSEDSPVDEKSDNGDPPPPPPPPNPPDSATVTVRLLSWDDLSGPGPVEPTPGDVDEVRFDVMVSDTDTETRTITPGSELIVEEFRFATGATRRIEIQAYDDVDALLYRGIKYANVVDSILVAGVVMVSTTDDTPPTHAGLDDAVAVSDSYVLLGWLPADNGTASSDEVMYLIYMSTESGNFDYTSPDYTTAAGETSLLITELDPETTYYFVTRAMDRSGNVNANTAQQSVTTTSAGAALYVDVASGSDYSGCGTSSSPCKTITYALSKTAGNQTINVAKGTYNAASGEVFPLQLKTGTRLIGDGFWWMGVKVIKLTYIDGPGPVILGADNATIISCYVRPTDWGTSGRGIDDGGHPITVFHCTVDGALLPTGHGVAFYGASSLIDSRVENFTAGGGRSVGVWGGGGALIEGNLVYNNASGIAVGVSNTTIRSNVVEDITSVGINVGAIDATLDDIAIHHNYVTNTGGNGMQLTDVTDTKITFNSISHMGGYGISVNVQQPTHMMEIYNNSMMHGSSSAIWLTSGGAKINGNTMVCNVAGVYLSTDQVVDLRHNSWEHDPPTISPGRGPSVSGCDGFFDICYQRDYAGTPTPLYQPDHGKGSCLIGIVPVPSPRGDK
jgi:parallel beta-helix repeat protein